MRDVGDIHKANDFLRNVVKPAMFAALVTTYVTTLSVPPLRYEDVETKDVMVWVEEILNDSSSVDLKFGNYAFFLFRILPAYELIKKGVRTGDMSMYNAGRRLLLPFVFALGRTTYGPAVVRDMFQYYHVVPEEIREEIWVIFGLNNEGLDGKLEEWNKKQKAHVISNSEMGVQAGALLCNQASALSDAQRSFSATKALNRDSTTVQPFFGLRPC